MQHATRPLGLLAALYLCVAPACSDDETPPAVNLPFDLGNYDAPVPDAFIQYEQPAPPACLGRMPASSTFSARSACARRNSRPMRPAR